MYKVDDIIDYSRLNNEATVDDDDNKGNMTDGDGLLYNMAGCSSSAGDIRKVMATKNKIPHKGKRGKGSSCKVDSSKLTPSTILI
jgi:hypothetical protein